MGSRSCACACVFFKPVYSRILVPFLDRKKRTIVYTDFRDEITAVREDAAGYLPKMTGVEYEKKVQAYLKNHLDHIVIHRLRTNQPLTATDLRGLEQTLVEIGEDDGRTLLTGLLARSERDSRPLPGFISCGAWWGWTAPRHRRSSRSSSPTEA